MRAHLTPSRLVTVKKINKTRVGRMWSDGNPCVLLVGTSDGAAAVEDTTEVPRIVTNGTAL